MDRTSRKVLSWRVSTTMDNEFCVAALEEALQHYGTPEIFTTDQGCQFTSDVFTSVLKDAGVRLSLLFDGGVKSGPALAAKTSEQSRKRCAAGGGTESDLSSGLGPGCCGIGWGRLLRKKA
jgi:hypothetical protein